MLNALVNTRLHKVDNSGSGGSCYLKHSGFFKGPFIIH